MPVGKGQQNYRRVLVQHHPLPQQNHRLVVPRLQDSINTRAHITSRERTALWPPPQAKENPTTREYTRPNPTNPAAKSPPAKRTQNSNRTKPSRRNNTRGASHAKRQNVNRN